MEPEPERVDLSSLDPSRDSDAWQAAASRVAARALELRRLRRAVMRRGMVAVAVAAAASVAIWLAAPRREPRPRPQHTDVYDWATRSDIDPMELLVVGGDHAE